jgi:hypothetical protein
MPSPIQVTTASIIAASLVAFVACGPNGGGNGPVSPGPGGNPTSGGKAIPKQGALVSGKAKKGGSGKENGSGGQTSSKTMSAASSAGNADNADNDCAGVPDGDAICKGSQISICQGEQEYFLDCNQYAKNEGWQTGDCFEHEKITDCMGCETHADGTSACCDVEMKSICCNDAGDCWAP